MAISQGTKFGRYEIRSQIGAGGMGEVYRAYDPKLKRDVAIKVLPANFSTDADRLRRFEQEAQAAGALNHPNILSVYDVDAFNGSPYVVSELLEGETLRKRMSGTALPQRKAIEYALQIAKGLAAAHEKGIVHRDLKPDNLFIMGDGRVKILDFGLAKLTRPRFASEIDGEAETEAMRVDTDPGIVMGTVGYMSPEQVRGQRVDHRADIFSFGVILYEMLSGKRPFHGESAVETLSAILKEEPPELCETNRQIAPALERVVRHCLEKSPEARFQSASDLGFALEALSGLSIASATSPTLTPLAASSQSKRRWWPIIAALALLTGLAGGVFTGKPIWKTIPPSFHPLTFRRGTIWSARFTPDGQTIIYGAAWEGKPTETFSTRSESTESRPLDLPDANILAISSAGEMAIQLKPRFIGNPIEGTLARASLAGGAPRELIENVLYADWSPNGKDLAVVHGAGGKWRLEFPIGTKLYETDGWISYPRVSPKGDLIAFFDQPVRYDTRGSVAVVDLAGNKKTLFSGSAGLWGLAWSPYGDEIWFSGIVGDDTGVFAVTLSARQRLVVRVPGIAVIHDVSRDGHILMTRESIRIGLIGLAPGETKERDLSWLDGSFARDISADGKSILFDEEALAGGSTASVYRRKMDGSPAVRLGDGYAIALSPDGKWVLASFRHTSPLQLVLMATGAGELKRLSSGRIIPDEVGSWFPDSKRVLFVGSEPGHGPRCYVQNIDVGEALPVTPEGITAGGLISPEGIAASWITPDGKYVIAGEKQKKLALYPIEGGEVRPIPGLEIGDVPIRWSADGRALYLFRLDEVPAKVYRLDISTGRKELWKELVPADPAGIPIIYTVELTPDAKSYAYTYLRDLSELYMVEGLK